MYISEDKVLVQLSLTIPKGYSPDVVLEFLYKTIDEGIDTSKDPGIKALMFEVHGVYYAKQDE